MQQLLQAHFGDCKFLKRSKCINKSPYENVNEELFYVYDPGCDDQNNTQPCRIVSNTERYQLTVNNPGNTNICFVKTDKCLFSDQVSKCDCILFNKDKVFLVEIKNTNSGGRREKRNIAIRQLGTTIETLDNHGITINNFEAKAIICFQTRNNRPIQAATTTKQAEFLAKYNVILDEINEIAF